MFEHEKKQNNPPEYDKIQHLQRVTEQLRQHAKELEGQIEDHLAYLHPSRHDTAALPVHLKGFARRQADRTRRKDAP